MIIKLEVEIKLEMFPAKRECRPKMVSILKNEETQESLNVLKNIERADPQVPNKLNNRKTVLF